MLVGPVSNGERETDQLHGQEWLIASECLVVVTAHDVAPDVISNHTTLPSPEPSATPHRSLSLSRMCRPRPVGDNSRNSRRSGRFPDPSVTSTPNPSASRRTTTDPPVPPCSTAFVTTSLRHNNITSRHSCPAKCVANALRTCRGDSASDSNRSRSSGSRGGVTMDLRQPGCHRLVGRSTQGHYSHSCLRAVCAH